MNEQFDVAVLGSGPGGYAAAIHAAQAGLRTVIVEKGPRLGGTCTLVGCIPTKALLHSAGLYEELRHAGDHGLVLEGNLRVQMAGVLARKSRVVDQSVNGINFLMRKNGITVVHGFGRLAGRGRLEVAGEGGVRTLGYRKLILATGSTVREFPGLESDGRVVLNSDQILELDRVPDSLLVVGAGAVGMEFASIFASFGTRVTLVELMPHLLPLEDEDVSREVERAYRRRGIEFLLEHKVERLERRERGAKVLVTSRDGATRELEVELVLSAIGRKPATEGIGLETTAIRTERGFIPVDGMMRTAEPDVYAIGDVVPTPMLAHLATQEALLAVDHLAGRTPAPLRYERCPSATYCSPEVASVGLTEKQARARGYEVKTGSFPFSANGKARILGEAAGLIKVVSDARYDEVLGVHMVGPHVTDLISEACAALRLEATTEDLARTIHPHPTLAEAVGEAAHVTMGHPLHI